MPRVAVLAPMFRESTQVRVFPNGWTSQAEAFHPQAIAAPLPLLESLRGIAEPEHALIVFLFPWEPRVPEPSRDRLWRAFGVPIFEQVISERGELLATECEAHDGLHIVSRDFAVGDHEMDSSRCACGETSPRWIAQPVHSRAIFAGR